MRANAASAIGATPCWRRVLTPTTINELPGAWADSRYPAHLMGQPKLLDNRTQMLTKAKVLCLHTKLLGLWLDEAGFNALGSQWPWGRASGPSWVAIGRLADRSVLSETGMAGEKAAAPVAAGTDSRP